MHYVLEMSRHTNIVYIGMYFVLTYLERLFIRFFGYICSSVNYMSRVSNFHNSFVHLRAFSIVIYGKFNFKIPVHFLVFLV